ncbi:MAG TPA: PilZ domain-containing protein [Sphingomicrobium sp.]|nr:PilZ domain-containing protein [Sphingomicrobium sp.]
MTPENERRRWPRRRVEAKAEFRRKREMRYSIPVHDLTAQGCRIGSPERLIRGETVWLQLPSLESLPATVRWTGLGVSGVEFDQPMHTAVYEMMTGRLAPIAP